MGSPASHWPHAVTLVLAAESPRQRSWATETAIELVRKLAGDRKVVLADVRGYVPSSIAERLEVEEGEGMVDVLFRGASFSAVSKRPPSEMFYFVTAGTALPPLNVFYHHPRWQKIASRLAAADAHLLPCVTAADWLEAGPIPGFEACIVLNGTGREAELPTGARRLAEFLAPAEIREELVVETPVEVVDEVDAEEEAEREKAAVPSAVPAPAAEETPGPDMLETDPPFEPEFDSEVDGPEPVTAAVALPDSGLPQAAAEEPQGGISAFAARIAEAERAARASPLVGFMSGPRRRSIVPAVALAAAIALVILLLRFVGGSEAPASSDATAATDTTEAAGPGAILGDADPTGARPGEAILPYSVAIASYSSLDDALARQRGLERADLPVYVAPTPVRGVVYYRVFAGMLGDREGGDRLMAELVRRGIKDTVRAWDVRPARYAFFFGLYPTAKNADRVIETLQGQGIPAYAVPAASLDGSGDPAYRVYAGGCERIEDAQPLRMMLVRAGLESELVERVGWVSQ